MLFALQAGVVFDQRQESLKKEAQNETTCYMEHHAFDGWSPGM
jgi:hypothetical protein